MLVTGLQKLMHTNRVVQSIAGERIWYASGTITDCKVKAAYQKSLCLIIGPDGIMFTSSFWLPNFLVRRCLLPWCEVRELTIGSDSLQFQYNEVDIVLHGRRVSQTVQRYSPRTNPDQVSL